jgi:hypothetical protein
VASEASATPLRSYAPQSLIERCTAGFPAFDLRDADAIQPFLQRFPASKGFLLPKVFCGWNASNPGVERS